jgi:hypothetical protein
MIKYYPEKPAHDDVEPRGWLSLEGCIVEELGTEDGFLFSVKGARSRRFVLSVESEKERAQWLTAIKRAMSLQVERTGSTGDDSHATFRIYLSKYGRNIFLRACDADTAASWITTVRASRRVRGVLLWFESGALDEK